MALSVCKQIAEDCCLTIVGSLVTSGSKLGLALDQNADSQFWSMKSDGRIYSKLKPNLVLDVKGKNHLFFLLGLSVLNRRSSFYFRKWAYSWEWEIPYCAPATVLHTLLPELTESPEQPWRAHVIPSHPILQPKKWGSEGLIISYSDVLRWNLDLGWLQTICFLITVLD